MREGYWWDQARLDLDPATATRLDVASYFRGIRRAIRTYAVWREGVQYVGVQATRLEEVLADVDYIERQWYERVLPAHEEDGNDGGLHKDGLHVHLFRDSDQRLLVCIESHDLAEHGPDVHPGGDCIPRIRVRVNESLQEIGPDGEWVTL